MQIISPSIVAPQRNPLPVLPPHLVARLEAVNVRTLKDWGRLSRLA